MLMGAGAAGLAGCETGAVDGPAAAGAGSFGPTLPGAALAGASAVALGVCAIAVVATNIKAAPKIVVENVAE